MTSLQLILASVAIASSFLTSYVWISRANKKENRKRRKLIVIGFYVVAALFVLISPLLQTIPKSIEYLFTNNDSILGKIHIEKFKFQKSDRINILILPFKQFGGKSNEHDAATIITDLLNSEIKKNFNDSILSLVLLPDSLFPFIETHEEAFNLGYELNADIVIWGEIIPPLFAFQDFYITPYMTLLTPIRAIPQKIKFETASSILGKPIGISFFDQLFQSPSQLISSIIAYSFYLKKDFLTAIKYFEKASSSVEEPYSDIINHYIGSSYFNLFKSNRIARHLFQDVKYNNLQETYLTLAELHFRNALKINPNNGYALNGIGAIYLESARRDITKSLEYFLRAYDVDSSLLFVSSNLGLLYSHFLMQPKVAIKFYEKSLLIINSFPEDLTSNKAEILRKLGAAYIQNENFQKAESLLVASSIIWPDLKLNFPAFINLAALYEYQWKMDSAYTIITKLFDCDSSNKIVRSLMGAVLLNQNDYDKAKNYLLNSREISEGIVNINSEFYLFGLYSIEGKYDSANTSFNLINDILNKPTDLFPKTSYLEYFVRVAIPGTFDHVMLNNQYIRKKLKPYLNDLRFDKFNEFRN